MRIGDFKETYAVDEAVFRSWTVRLWLWGLSLAQAVFHFVAGEDLVLHGQHHRGGRGGRGGLERAHRFHRPDIPGPCRLHGRGGLHLSYPDGQGGASLSADPAPVWGGGGGRPLRPGGGPATVCRNLFRTRLGRVFIAIRDRDISAELMG